MTSDTSAPDKPGFSNDEFTPDVPAGVDRRTFLMRSAVIGATAVITGRTISAQAATAAATAPPPTVPLSPGSTSSRNRKARS